MDDPSAFERPIRQHHGQSDLAPSQARSSSCERNARPRIAYPIQGHEPIRIRTFGQFSVTTDGEALRFSRKVPKRPLTLLKALIALRGEEVAEHRLTDLLWPDLEGDCAHAAFTMALYRLRKLLGRHEAVRLRDGKLKLNKHVCWIDANALDSLELASCGRDIPSEEASGILAAALDLYRGQFLAAEDGHAWAFARTAHHRDQFVRIVTACAHRLGESDCWQEVLVGCRRAIERDDQAEALYQWIMRAALHLHSASEGLAAFERLRRMLWILAAASPCAESERLARQLRS